MSFRINVVKDVNLDAMTLAKEDLLKQTSRSYTPEEMAEVFHLYNLYHPTANKKDTGCGSCRRQVLNWLTAKWHELNNARTNATK